MRRIAILLLIQNLVAPPAMLDLVSSRAQAEITFNFTEGAELTALATSNPTLHSQVLNGFISAGQLWKTVLNDNVTINVNINYAELSPNIIGQASSTTVYMPYSALKGNLGADATSNDDVTAYYSLPTTTTVGFLTNTRTGSSSYDLGSSYNNNYIAMTLANARAALAWAPSDGNIDASITFSSLFNFDFNRADGITAGQTDFVGVATHEIGHALGFKSGIDTVDVYSGPFGPGRNVDLNGATAGIGTIEDAFGTTFTPLDLFRNRNVTGAPGGGYDWRTGGTANFSIDGGATVLGTFSTGAYNGDGQQASHWKDNLNLGAMDPTLGAGEFMSLKALDVRALDVIGWNLQGQSPNITGNTTVDGTPYILQPAANLVIDGATSSPAAMLTMTRGASTIGLADANIGSVNQGILSVSGGSVFSNSGVGYVARGAGSTGSITITGVGSKWNSGNAIAVGFSGAGAANVTADADVTGAGSYIGYNPGSSGVVTISGPGSSWSNYSNGLIYSATIGYAGNGTLNVNNGAYFENYVGYVGQVSPGSGSVTVSGANSLWSSYASLYVGGSASGAGGIGNVLVSDGGIVSVGSVFGGTLKLWNAGSLTINGGFVTTQSFDRSLGTFNLHDGRLAVSGGTYTQAAGPLTIDGNTASALPEMQFLSGASTSGIQDLTVGYDKRGALTITGGSSMSNSMSTRIGYHAGSSGTVTVSGAGSQLSTAGELIAGRDGTGTLSVLDGGRVASYDGNVGLFSVGVGMATVSGANSQWAVTHDLAVGNAGTGTLNVSGGAVVTSDESYVGHQSSAVGGATISGVGSQWTTATDLWIGTSGIGTISVQAGGKVAAARAFIGYNAGSSGTATITGAGSKWENPSGLQVGISGNGQLSISNGGYVSSGEHAFIGNGGGGVGVVNVDGASSQLAVGNINHVGYYGTGTLNITNGGSVTNVNAFIGYGNTGIGTVTVDGSGSRWTNSNNLLVGNAGRATLNIQNGGVVSNVNGFVAYNGGPSDVNISSAGSQWNNTGNLYLGGAVDEDNGPATLNISAGGAASVSGTTQFWSRGTLNLSGGSFTSQSINRTLGTLNFTGGTLTVNGGAFTQASGPLTINGANTPTFVLQNGATLSGVTSLVVANGNTGAFRSTANFTLGTGGAPATMTVNTGGTATFDASLTIGAGTTLTQNGGSVTATSFNRSVGTFNFNDGIFTVNGGTYTQSNSSGVAANILTINGNSANANPQLQLSGGGATIGVQAVVVGSLSGNKGAVQISNGRVLNVATSTTILGLQGSENVWSGVSYVGLNSGSSGTATVTGAGSQWNSSLDLHVGLSGTGMLNVLSSGVVASRDGVLGFNGTGQGTATINGTGSEWNMSGAFYVGIGGKGTLNVEAGGKVTTPVGFLGHSGGSIGTAVITGAGSQWNNTGSFYLGGNASSAGGVASLTVSDGGAISVGGTLKLWNAGTLTLNGGSVSAQSFDRSLGTVNFNDGTMTVNGGAYTQTGNFLLIDGNSATALPTFALTNGATTSPLGQIVVGQNQKGALQISGPTTLTSSGDMQLGLYGTGSLSLASGGKSVNPNGYLGNQPGAVGSAMIDGTGSQWTLNNALYAGRQGQGTVNVQNGGKISSVAGFVGYLSGSQGTVNIQSNADWTLTNALRIGYEGSGALNLTSGGTVNSPSLLIGDAPGSSGTVNISGSMSQITSSIQQYVGSRGTGLLEIQSGGKSSTLNAYIGASVGSSGTATVTGAGSQWNITNNLYLGGIFEPGGSSTLNILNGGAVNVTGNTVFWHGTVNIGTGSSLSTGNLELKGGTLNLNGSLTASQVLVNGGTLVSNGPTASIPLTVSSGLAKGTTAYSSITINGGSYSPGNSPGTTPSGGSTNWTSGSYIWEINQAASGEGMDPGWDLWHTGTLTISPGFSIDVTSLTLASSSGNVYDFDPFQNYAWRIATSINGAFTNLGLLVLNTTGFSNPFTGFFSLSATNADNDLVLNYNASAAAVPEPTGVLMLLTVLAPAIALAERRRRRNSRSEASATT